MKEKYEERVKKWDWHSLATKALQWNLPRITRSGKLSAIFISLRNFTKWEVETRSRHEEGKRWKSQRLVHANLSHNSVLNRQKVAISKIYRVEFDDQKTRKHC